MPAVATSARPIGIRLEGWSAFLNTAHHVVTDIEPDALGVGAEIDIA